MHRNRLTTTYSQMRSGQKKWGVHQIWSRGFEQNAVTLHVRNLGFIFFDQISSVSKSCYYHKFIRHLRYIRPYLDTKTASTTATSVVHSKLWLLQLSLSQPAQVSDHPAPTDPELSCTCCCRSSQIQTDRFWQVVYWDQWAEIQSWRSSV